jgi:pilus assembly protein Flp/PilA
MRKLLRRLTIDPAGATAVEYGLIVALIVLAIVAALTQLAGRTITLWQGVSDNVSANS